MNLIEQSLQEYYNEYLRNDYVKVGDVEVARSPVTQLEWFLVMKNNPSYFIKNGVYINNLIKLNCLFPVESVSYNDCLEFLNNINVIDNKYNYRLPTDDEWLIFSGNPPDDIGKYAWTYENSKEMVHTIKQKLHNKYGLYDVWGNIWEWNSSRMGSSRVIRGGYWNSLAEHCRVAYRYYGATDRHSSGVGFRLVRTLK